MNNANANSFLAEANSDNLYWYCHKNYPEPNRNRMYGTPTFATRNGNNTASNQASGESPTTTSFVPYRNPFVPHDTPTMGQVVNTTSAQVVSYNNPVPVHKFSNKRTVLWSEYDMSNVPQENAAWLKISNETATLSGRKKRKEPETTPDAVKRGRNVAIQTSAKRNDTDKDIIISQENDNESENSNDGSMFKINAHYEKLWFNMFDRLIEYKKKNGTTKVPYNYQEDPQLRNWCHCQKHYCKRADRRAILESIGFQWSTKYKPWDEMYDRLVKFQKEHGHTRVGLNYEPDPNLGLWVKRQRIRCTEKGRVDKMNDIGFEWRIMKRYDWQKLLPRLVAFKQKYNTTRVPRDYKDDPELATWVRVQRFHCRDQTLKDRLDEIDFEWPVPKDDEWYSMFKRLLEYKKKYQTTHIHKDYEDSRLQKWVRRQRYFCKKEDRRRKLDDIGFIWPHGKKKEEV